MSPVYWFPQSFFARTLWLVLAIVLFSKALTFIYLMINDEVLVDRQYSHGAALILRAYWAADEEDRPQIAEAAGLVHTPIDDVPKNEQHWPYSTIFERQMQGELGPDTQVRLHAQNTQALWVLAPNLGNEWLRIPMYPNPLRGQRLWTVLLWLLAIGLLSTATAWIFVRQLNVPLSRLVYAARQVGKGRSIRLPVDAPSEMQEVYRAFNQMAADVEQATRERELMLAGVSHDLRTPLTRLRLALEFMETDSDLAQDMVRDIEDMDAILDQFLAFIRDGRGELIEEVDFVELVREVVSAFNQNEDRVQLRIDSGIPAFPLRKLSIKRLLNNLIGNALNHGGKDVEVVASLSGERYAPYIVLSVLDRGAGIDPAEFNSIFNPFIRGDRARGGRGTGLGLAIVRRIAAIHGGSVELRNRAGGGLEARVCLPLGLLLPRDAS